MKKNKILLLSTHDSHLGGHAWSEMRLFDNSKYDVKLVTLYSLHNTDEYAIIKSYTIYRYLDAIFKIIFNIVFFGRIRGIAHDKYCYFRVNHFPVSAKQILKKYNNGIPDIIILYWCDGFISSKTLYKLYKLTGAKIHIVFTDEHPLTGGCHYPCECVGYQTGCLNCPALLSNERIAAKVLSHKNYYYSKIPKVVITNTAGINKAEQALVFKHKTSYIKEVGGVHLSCVPSFDRSREYFGVPQDAFVIMFGAVNINEERKGLHILLQALRLVAKQINTRIIALVPGNIFCDIDNIDNVQFKLLGLLEFDDLCKAFAASNVYVSPSLADAGPMMVRYSIACGTPVVAFPIGNALDFVKHQKTGYLAEYGDPQDLANGIIYFYENQHRLLDFRENCLQLNSMANNILSYHHRIHI